MHWTAWAQALVKFNNTARLLNFQQEPPAFAATINKQADVSVNVKRGCENKVVVIDTKKQHRDKVCKVYNTGLQLLITSYCVFTMKKLVCCMKRKTVSFHGRSTVSEYSKALLLSSLDPPVYFSTQTEHREMINTPPLTAH